MVWSTQGLVFVLPEENAPVVVVPIHWGSSCCPALGQFSLGAFRGTPIHRDDKAKALKQLEVFFSDVYRIDSMFWRRNKSTCWKGRCLDVS